MLKIIIIYLITQNLWVFLRTYSRKRKRRRRKNKKEDNLLKNKRISINNQLSVEMSMEETDQTVETTEYIFILKGFQVKTKKPLSAKIYKPKPLN